MGTKITIDELASLISDDINKYSEEVVDNLNQVLKKSANNIKENIKVSAPRSGDKQAKGYKALADSFTIKETKEVKGNSYTIWSPKKYRIVHLLENGFYHVRGKRRIAGRPFMRPSFEKEKPNIDREVLKAIKGGNING